MASITSDAEDATRPRKMRARPLWTYLLFVGDARFVAGGGGKGWQKVDTGPNVVRPRARPVTPAG